MQAFMYPATARALLAKSREFTQAKRQAKARAARFAEGLAIARRMRFSEDVAHELATIYADGVQQ
jgi:hypothetical protein